MIVAKTFENDIAMSLWLSDKNNTEELKKIYPLEKYNAQVNLIDKQVEIYEKQKVMRVTNENTNYLLPNEIFVFGSNLSGRHGAGAARFAMDNFGAQYGVGEGFTGQCWALPTKDENIQVRDLESIRNSISKLFVEVVKQNDKFFIITAVGCGLAGLKAEEIAPMFEKFTLFENISLPQSFIDVLNKS